MACQLIFLAVMLAVILDMVLFDLRYQSYLKCVDILFNNKVFLFKIFYN